MLPKSKYSQYAYRKHPLMNLKNIYRNRYDKPPVNLKMRRKYLRSRDTPGTSKTLSFTLLRNNDFKNAQGDCKPKKTPNVRVKYATKTKNDFTNNSLKSNKNIENLIFEELKKITIQFKWVKNVYKNLIYNKSKIKKVFIENKVVQTDNINNSGLTKHLPKTIRKQRKKILDDIIMKNKEIIKKLLRKSSQEQISNKKLLETLIKITNQSLFTPIITELIMLREENYYLKEEFNGKLNVFREKIEETQSIQNEYLNLIFSITLPKNDTSNWKTFETENSDINDNIDEHDVMNNVKVNNNKKKSKRLINKKNKIEDPMDVLVYQKKFSGKSESAPSSVRSYHHNEQKGDTKYETGTKRKYCFKHGNRDSLTHISTSVYTSDDSSISFYDGEQFENNYAHLSNQQLSALLCNKQINNSPMASFRDSIVGDVNCDNKTMQQNLYNQNQQEAQQQQLTNINSYNGFKNKSTCNTSDKNNNCKRNLQNNNNISSSLSLGSSDHSELKLSSPSKASRSSSRNLNKSYSMSSSKKENSFAKKSPERIKSKSMFLRLICCTNN